MRNDYMGLICHKKSNENIKDFDYKNKNLYLKSNSIVEKENIAVIFNGEINNLKELQQMLNTKTKTTENIIISGFKKYNTDIFKYINGFYSCIIYDTLKEELYLVRDKIGTKSIYYKYINNNLYFSDSIKKLVKEFDLKKEINFNSFANYLSFQYSGLENTLYQDIKRVMPGQLIHYHNKKIDIIKYYEPKFTHDNTKTNKEITKEIHKIASNIIKKYEKDSNNITTFLSSGVDSSYITSLSEKSKDTYTISFEGLKENESTYSMELSKKLNKNNIVQIIDGDTYFDAIKEISSFIEEPLADPSSVGMFLLCKKASEKYKTAMIGEGPDEFFAGYNVYKEPLQLTSYNKIPFFIRKTIGIICSCLPKIRGINFLIRRGKTIEEWYIGNANIFTYKERKKILKEKRTPSVPPPHHKAIL